MTHVVLHGFHRSPYVTIAKLALAAKGVEFLFHDTEEAMSRSGGWTLHPFARVPVLTHDDFTVCETAAIAAYVDEAFLGPALSPTNARERARMNQWISSVNSYYAPWIHQLVRERTLFRERDIAADEARAPAPRAVVAAALRHVHRGLEVLERTLGTGAAFLAGERQSLADYFMLPMVAALGRTDEGRQELSRALATLAWMARMAVLPEVQATGASMPERGPIVHARRWGTGHRPSERP